MARFNIPPDLAAYWRQKDKPKATDRDVEVLRTAFDGELPRPYEAFLRTYGYVVFSMDFADSFSAIFDEGKGAVTQQGSIAYVMAPEHVLTACELATRVSHAEGLPAFPPNFVPVGGDTGRSLILLEREPEPGRVWYWPDRDLAWGEVGNTALGYVASDFYEFINGLRAYVED
ncbi:MAG: SMI1/KNR4 family protein [Pseudomonadota bacterium]